MGVIAMLLSYGMLQERIMAIPYGNEFFTVSIFLVLCNRLMAIGFALTMLCVRREPLGNAAPLWKYLLISFSNVAASSCQYDALKYVSYPVQMLGKSFKMMPVMLWGMVLSNRTYGAVDWVIAALVTGGVTQFIIGGQLAPQYITESTGLGLLTFVMFLALVGFTSTFQEAVFIEHKTSKYNQMLYINIFSASVSLLILGLSGSWRTALDFCWQHPALIQDATYLSVAAVGAQWFIYAQVKDYGALVLAVTMNVREVISTLLSLWMYGRSVSILQAAALFLVFGSLAYKSLLLVSENGETSKGEGIPFFAEGRKASKTESAIIEASLER
eukprot:CAMPEP_0170614406 /NCGR_PEP_ID=MMETSP0224-20130122/24785_1 /TAXON_ID=285029 /ORGANISM="Togula jolla, Strain CCCM 725" /LENGTH=328 /DNA_ID=CAMNT_0010940065 /DNA_START=243 /DNA_END=1229 /DNA_ORIENTATION=-